LPAPLPPPPPPLRIKLLVFGPAGCGKSSLVKRLVENRFATRASATIGVDFGVWAPPTASTAAAASATGAAGRSVRLQFFDLGGADAYLEVRVEFYRAEAGMHGALLCFDSSERASFDALGAWLAEARAGGLGAAVPSAVDAPPAAAPLPPLPPLPVLLCACKTEARPRAVPEAEARAWAERSGLAGYFETSASLGIGQVEVFARLESLATERALAAEARELRGAVR
jgi:GTPase SAR1 family protein